MILMVVTREARGSSGWQPNKQPYNQTNKTKFIYNGWVAQLDIFNRLYCLYKVVHV